MSNPLGYTLRREIMDFMLNGEFSPAFVELAPENWIGIGGIWKRKLEQIKEIYPITSHGLSLSIGSPDPLDINRLKTIKCFLDTYNISIYSEHLAFSTINNAHLYESLPIPFTLESLEHITKKILIAQDILERPLVLENVCYYVLPDSEFEEVEYLKELQKRTDCGLLLDISNVYVNAKNHGYNILKYFENYPLEKVHYVHLGSFDSSNTDCIFDSHDRSVDDSTIKNLLSIKDALPINTPICIERESNFESKLELLEEYENIKSYL